MTEFTSAEEYDRTTTLHNLESDYRRLAGLLGVAPSASRMAEHEPSSKGRLRSLYPSLDGAEAYERFLEDAGIADADADAARAEQGLDGSPPPT